MARKREIVSFYDFTGGLNDTLTPDRMSPRELEQADNIDLSMRGGFSYRYGTINSNEESFGSNVMYVIEFPLKDGNVMELSVMSDKKLYETTDGIKREVKLLNSYDIDYIIYRNTVYLVDGKNYYSYGGVDYTTQSGSITIKKDDIVENYPVSTGTNPGIEKRYYKALSDMTSADLKSVNYGDTSKWVDITHSRFNIPDVLREVKIFKDKANDEDYKNTFKEINKCTFIEVHPKSHRIFLGGNPDDNSCLYFSESGEPDNFKPTNKLYPTGGEGPIKAIRPMLESIIVGYKYGWWEFSGIDDTDWKWIKLPIPYGPVNNRVVELTPASFTFFAENGIWKVSIAIINSNIVISSEEVLLKNITDGRVEGVIKSIKNHKYTTATFSNGKYYLAYSEGNTNINDKVLVYDIKQDNFVRYTDLKIIHLFKKLDGFIYFGSINYIFKFDKNFLNDTNEFGETVPIKLNVKTIRFNFDTPFNIKLFHRFFFSSSQGADVGNHLNMWIKVDYATSNSYFIDLNNESLIWGVTEWGKVWGVADIASMELGLRRKGTRVQLIWNGEMINNMNSVIVYGIGFDVEYLRAKARNMGTKRLLDEDYNMID